MRTGTHWIAALAAALCLAYSAVASAENVPLVDGVIWGKSAPILKRSFLIGVSNLMTVEYLYQQKFGPAPDYQTTVRRLYEGVDDVTLDETIRRIDAWYKEHPEEMSTTVLEVIWVDMVRPNLPEERIYDLGDD